MAKFRGKVQRSDLEGGHWQLIADDGTTYVLEGTTKALEIDVTPVLSTHKAPKRVNAGATVSLTGRVRPATKVSVLVEREGADGKFRHDRFVSARLSKTNWRTAVRLRRPGLYRLTARTGGGAGRAVYVRAERFTGGAGA